jgi:uncharacterized protein YndB with AHSA1/START domain
VSTEPIPGDEARASVHVRVDPQLAFELFTEDIDQWWKRGIAYRVSGKHRGIMHIEAGEGGRLFESYDAGGTTKVVQTGTVMVWDPPHRLVFEWRGVNFAPGERTEVEVLFEPKRGGTMVKLTHRGWAALRPDHPARHGHDVVQFIGMMGRWWGSLLSSLRERSLARVDA